MSEPTPTPPAVERNLLLGLLAYQMDFITRDTLIAALQGWVQDRTNSLGQILVERRFLSEDRLLLLQALVEEHLKQHDQDVGKSLASVSSLRSLRPRLEEVSDPAFQTLLTRVFLAQGTDEDPHATRPPSEMEAHLLGSGQHSTTGAGPRFRILRTHARGGLGEVYLAHDEELHREVALKEIQARHADNPDNRSRFLLEAEITGGLEHPGIVPVYGLGQYADGRPFYAMRFIKGESLHEVIRRFHQTESPERDPGERALALRQLLGRFLDVCNAIAYAHSRGVLHRDLKPGNIMLGQYGETLVVDWGLAKLMSRADEVAASQEAPLKPTSASNSAPTQIGSVIGTPAYMSPEQAAGRLDLLGAGSDVYSLGATLYCLLAGKAPYEGVAMAVLLDRIQQGDFPPPRQVNGKVPPALEAICLKALAVKPEDRYPSPRALADDIEHWLADEPVSAHRETWPQRMGRWVRRHRTWALAGAVALILVSLTSVLAAVLVNQARQQAIQEQREAEKQRGLAEERQREADKQRALANEKQQEAVQLSTNLALDRGLTLCEQGEVARGMLWLAASLQIAPTENPGLERTIRTNLAGWQHQLIPPRAILSHDDEVLAVAYRPDGEVVLTGCADGMARLWDVGKGEQIRSLKHEAPVQAVAFSPDGNTLLTGTGRLGEGGGNAHWWDAKTGKALGLPLPHPSMVWSVAYSPDGKRALTGSNDGAARVWELATGQLQGAPLGHGAVVRSVAFSPDGKQVLTGGEDGVAHVWDATTQQRTGAALRHDATIQAVAFSPDGKTALTGSWDTTAGLWEVSTGKRRTLPLRHRHEVWSVAFSPDGTRALTGTYTGARLWETTNGSPVSPELNHQAWVGSVAFGPDGQTFLTGCSDGTARLWQVSLGTLRNRTFPVSLRPYYRTLDASPDGKTVLLGTATSGPFGGYYGEAQLWNVGSGELRAPPFRHPSDIGTDPLGGGVVSAVFSPDGRTVLTGGWFGSGLVCDAQTGRPLGKVLRHKQQVRGVAYSSDSKRMVTVSEDQTAQVWEVATGNPLGQSLQHQGPVWDVAFSPDGNLVLTGSSTAGNKGEAQLWDVARSTRVGPALRHENRVRTVAFSPDGKMIVTGSADHTAQRWETETGKRLGRALQHQGTVVALAFSPDGKTLLTGSEDTTAQLWESATGKAIGPPLQHEGPLPSTGPGKDFSRNKPFHQRQKKSSGVTDVAFSPDGKTVLTGSRDATARLWDATTGKPVGPALAHEDWVTAVAYCAADRVVTASWDLTACVWNIPRPIAGSAEQVQLWVQVVTGLELSQSTGAIRRLDDETWRRRSRRLREQIEGNPSPDLLSVTAEQVAAWHRRQANESELADQWYAVVWHLDRLHGAGTVDESLLRRRGHAHAQLGQWARAARDFAEVQKRNRTSVTTGYWLALTQLALDDVEAYRRTCKGMLEQFGESKEEGDLHALTAACILHADTGIDPTRLVELAEKVMVGKQNKPEYLRTLGATLLRAKRYEEARRRLEEAMKAQLEEGAARDWVWLALVSHHLGQREEARKWLDQAVRGTAEAVQPLLIDRGPFSPPPWVQRLETQILLREAEKLIKGS